MAEGVVDDPKIGFGPFGYGIVLEPVFFVHYVRSASAIEFYKAVFGAEEAVTKPHPTYVDKPLTAELRVGSNVVCSLEFIGQEEDESNTIYPDYKYGWEICIYPTDIKGLIKKACENGAELDSKVPQGFDYKVNDPIGNVWFVGSLKKKKKKPPQA